MKLIVTGGTGQIGSAVLRRCLQNTAITKVFALTRRPLPEDLTSSGKIKNIIHSDFSQYPNELLSQLEGAEACIWSIGVIPRKAVSKEIMQQGDVDTTLNGAAAFVDKLQPHLGDGKFRFLYISAVAVERDQEKELWFMTEPRRSKGVAENGLIELAEKHSDEMDLLIARSGLILREANWIPNALISVFPYGFALRESQMAAALLDLVENGHDDQVVTIGSLHALGIKLAP